MAKAVPKPMPERAISPRYIYTLLVIVIGLTSLADLFYGVLHIDAKPPYCLFDVIRIEPSNLHRVNLPYTTNFYSFDS